MAQYDLTTSGQRLRFILGLGLIISLVYLSVLGSRQVSSFEYLIVASLTIAALIFDYRLVGRFLILVEDQEKAGCSHEMALGRALTAALKLPLLVRLLETELLALYYAFLANFESRRTISHPSQFCYSKSSNAHDVFMFVAFSQLPFLPFIHIFLEHAKGPGPAWLVTLLTLWSVIWYLAQVEAVKFRPIRLCNDLLIYRFGLMWSAEIPLSGISSARSVDAAETLNDKDLFVSPLGSTKNVLLEFHKPVRFSGPFFLKRSRTKAAISLDCPSQFLNELGRRGIEIRRASSKHLPDRKRVRDLE